MKKTIWLFSCVALLLGAGFWSAGAFADGVSAGSVARITGGTINGASIGETVTAVGKFSSVVSGRGLFSADAAAVSLRLIGRQNGAADENQVEFFENDGIVRQGAIAGTSGVMRIYDKNYATRFEVDTSGVSVTGTATFSTTIKTGAYTVATLPTCNAGAAGTRAYVTDATAPTWNAALTGGGAVVAPAFCNGTAWVSS